MNTRSRHGLARPGIALLLLMLCSLLLFNSGFSHADENDYATLQRGLYLVRAGDCAACHTVDPDRPFAGDRALPTPFGTIYTSNLTPDEDTGIGLWTRNEFYDALHSGEGDEGENLYPAFPYVHFTLVSREDSDDMYAYLQTLEPIRNVVREPEFIWPLSVRTVVKGWNLLNFDQGEFVPDVIRSDEWNRGRYLVEGLGHCGMCHSPKNFMGAEKEGDWRFTGGMAEGWWAPALTNSTTEGIGHWTKEDIVEFLQHGRNEYTAAFGPMAEVIDQSTRFLTEADLQAIAEYLTTLTPSSSSSAEGRAADSTASPISLDSLFSSDDTIDVERGQLIYEAQCSACHLPDGSGVPRMFGAIAGSGLAQASDPTSLIRLILEGAQSVTTEKYPTAHTMPAFFWKLDDADIAAVATYVRTAFGNRAGAVDADAVAAQRAAH